MLHHARRHGECRKTPRLARENYAAQRNGIKGDVDLMRNKRDALQRDFESRAGRGRIQMRHGERLIDGLADDDRAEEILDLTVQQSREVDRAIPALDCKGKVTAGDRRRGARNRSDAQAWRRARGKPVHPRISLRRVQTDAVKLDGVGRIELAVAFPDDRDRLRLPVDVELQVARVCVWSKTDGQKLGLGDAIPAFVINENLDGKLRSETEGRR